MIYRIATIYLLLLLHVGIEILEQVDKYILWNLA